MESDSASMGVTRWIVVSCVPNCVSSFFSMCSSPVVECVLSWTSVFSAVEIVCLIMEKCIDN